MNPESIGESIKVIAGSPTTEELAAIIATLEAARAEQVVAGKKLAKKPASSWNRNSSVFRNNLLPGYGQWRAQFRPGLD